MIFDRLHVAAELVALVQHRRVAVGKARAFVETAAGELAEPIEMRLDMAKQRLRQMDAQEIRQRGIGAIEVHAAGVRRQQTGRCGRDIVRLGLDRLVHDRPLSFPPCGHFALIWRLPLEMMSIMLQSRGAIKPQIVREA